MVTLVVERAAVRFPSRCVECGGPAEDHFSLKVPRHAERAAEKLEVPVCSRCSQRKSLGQFLWVGASALVGAFVLIGLADGLDALIPVFPWLRGLVWASVLVCFAAGAVPVVLAARGGRRPYHRRFSAVWVEGRGPTPAAVTLGLRSEELQRAVASLSGIPVLGGAPFREQARSPEAYQRPEGQISIPAWSLVLVGLGVVFAGVARYQDIGQQESRSLSIDLYWPEWILYKIAGRAGVLSMFAVVGAVITAAGVLVWRSAMRSRG